MMSQTFTRSVTDTYTEARARYVMGKVYDHLVSLFIRGLITKDYADSLRSDLLYLLDKRALTYFQLQFKTATGKELGGLHYEVKSDSSISIDDASGGLDFWNLPQTTSVSLLVSLNRASYYIDEVDKQLEAWGWGNGTALQGTHTASKTFSKDGFGLKESIVGQW